MGTPPGVIFQVIVTYDSRDGSLKVEGPMADKEWCVQALEHAIHSLRSSINRTAPLITPAKDISDLDKLPRSIR